MVSHGVAKTIIVSASVSYYSDMAQPADSITQALDNWMDRVQDANLEVHLELLTEDQYEDLCNTVRKLCSQSEAGELE